MRGRLIFPFVAELAPIDTDAMRDDPDGAGDLTSGYDNIFREPVKLPSSTGEGPGTTHRVEKATVKFPVQVETQNFDMLNMVPAGNIPGARFQLVFHFADLEAASYVDSNGEPMIRNNDRLVAIYTMQSVLVQRFERIPLYVTEVLPIGFGLHMGASTRNLLLVTFQDRETGVGG